ncbi:B12 binding domain protein [Roseivivax jejudonensis]|uniref:B12 binding domain protein n=1 Tax=Roseivivax jejudonensis TaxID=1529041 RepID=A0A1X6ZPY9_9RHOB|nr:cobalamin-dependent protein [Roseivivax jejudonensis]SLN58118.1 B12 binding domain protein [Roseivivax jejudonensis]
MPMDGSTTSNAPGRAEIATLAGTVVSLLNGATPRRAATRVEAGAQILYDATRPGLPFAATPTLAQLHALGLGAADIVDGCIPAAARRLGSDWLGDRLGFADVSIASARLQGLLPQLSPPGGPDGAALDEVRTALIVLAPDDTHTLGVHVAAAQLRRAGVSVAILFGPDRAALRDALARDDRDIVLFSCGLSERLPYITKMSAVLRDETDSGALSVLGGNVLDRHDDLGERTGVDLVTNDVRAALAMHGAASGSPVRSRR